MAAVCLDASLVLSVILPGESNEHAQGLFELWASDATDLIGPPLLFAETPSVLRNKVYRRELSREEGNRRLERFIELEIHVVSPRGLAVRAWEIATQFNQPRAYDAQYVALAELEGCDLWTSDRRLANVFRAALPWVHWVGEIEPQPQAQP